MADPPVESASIQSSGVGSIGMLAGLASAGLPVSGGIGVVSDSTNGGSGGRVVRLGRVVFMVAVLAGRGDRVKGWMAGATRTIE